MEFKSFISVRNKKPFFWLALIVCLTAICAVSCETGKVSLAESTKSPEPAKMPIVENYPTAESDEDTSQNAASNGTAPGVIKLKCKDAKEKKDRLLCKTLIPADLREEAAIMGSFEVTYYEIDLNGDGARELIMWESSWAGTSGGGLWVLDKRQNGYKKIFETEMTWTPIILLSSTHHGYRGFAYLTAGGGVKPFFTTVSYGKKSYKDGGKTTEEQPEGEVVIGKNWGQSVFGPISN